MLRKLFSLLLLLCGVLCLSGEAQQVAFEHQTGRIHELCFDGQAEPLKVTATHPIWSADRNDWVAAGELQVGERVQTRSGAVTLTAHRAKDTVVTVYNLEVYREHNFFVGQHQMLAHNGPYDDVVEGASSQLLRWGNNSKGHLIKHADVLGFDGYTPQQLQKMVPQLKEAASQLLNNELV